MPRDTDRRQRLLARLMRVFFMATCVATTVFGARFLWFGEGGLRRRLRCVAGLALGRPLQSRIDVAAGGADLNKLPKVLEPPVIDAESIERDRAVIAKYLRTKTPFVVSTGGLKVTGRPAPQDEFSIVNAPDSSRDLHELAAKVLGASAVLGMGVFFHGRYEGAATHMDFGNTLNLYYLLEGEKTITIVPEKFTPLLDIERASDHLYVAEEKGNQVHNESWLARLPYYYRWTARPRDALFFFNGSCFHKFVSNDDTQYSCTLIHEYLCGPFKTNPYPRAGEFATNAKELARDFEKYFLCLDGLPDKVGLYQRF